MYLLVGLSYNARACNLRDSLMICKKALPYFIGLSNCVLVLSGLLSVSTTVLAQTDDCTNNPNERHTIQSSTPTSASGEIVKPNGSGTFLLTRNSSNGFTDTVTFFSGTEGVEAQNNVVSLNTPANPDAFTYTYTVTPDSSNVVETINVFRKAVTTTGTSEFSRYNFTWTGGPAVLFDPINEFPSHANGALITSGETLVFRGVGGRVNRTSLWRLTIPTASVTLAVNADSPETDGDQLHVEWISFDTTFQTPLDFGDAPDSYGTTLAVDGANHIGSHCLFLGTTIDTELDGSPGITANGDGADEDGVGVLVRTSVAGTKNATLKVTFTNNTADDAQLVCWIDWNQDGDFLDADERSDPRIFATGCANVANATDSTFTTGNVPAACTDTPTLQWTNITGVTVPSLSLYSRCRITTDLSFASGGSPSPIGAVTDGEVEDNQIPVPPVVATIDNVSLESILLADFLGSASLDQLRSLLTSYVAYTIDMNRETMIAALLQHLDPDGDGRLALFRWNTLEELGTIGFYAERLDKQWIRINDKLLPSLISAPLGAEYLLLDPTVQANTTYQYRLIELEASGGIRSYGPYSLQMIP